MERSFTVDKKTLLPLLSALQPLCTKRTTLDATTHILVQSSNRELVLKGTDLEVSLQASCAVNASSYTAAESFLIPGKRIFDSIKEMDGDITCQVVDNQLVVQSDGVDLRLSIKSADEFPPFPERIENLLSVDAKLLSELFDKVAFVIPQNNSNPALNGLLVEIGPDGLSMTATDGHCLAHVTTSRYALDKKISWLMPRRSVFELKKILETSNDLTVFVGVCDGQLVFSGELFNFFTRLVANPFPEYRPILEREGFSQGSADRVAWTKALRRSICLLSGQFLATQFMVSPSSMRVLMNNKGIGTLDEQFAVEFAGESAEMRFYAPYLLEGLNAMGTARVMFFIKNSSRPIIFEETADDRRFVYLVMPVSPAQR